MSSTSASWSRKMKAASDWRIPDDAGDWECGWEGDRLFHLRHFRSFTLAEKIRAVEEMSRIAALLAGRRGRRSGNEATRASR